MILRHGHGILPPFQQEQIALDAQQLRRKPTLPRGFSALDRCFDHGKPPCHLAGAAKACGQLAEENGRSKSVGERAEFVETLIQPVQSVLQGPSLDEERAAMGARERAPKSQAM